MVFNVLAIQEVEGTHVDDQLAVFDGLLHVTVGCLSQFSTVWAGEVLIEIHLRGALLSTLRLEGDSTVVVLHGHIHVLGFKGIDGIRG